MTNLMFAESFLDHIFDAVTESFLTPFSKPILNMNF